MPLNVSTRSYFVLAGRQAGMPQRKGRGESAIVPWVRGEPAYIVLRRAYRVAAAIAGADPEAACRSIMRRLLMPRGDAVDLDLGKTITYDIVVEVPDEEAPLYDFLKTEDDHDDRSEAEDQADPGTGRSRAAGLDDPALR